MKTNPNQLFSPSFQNPKHHFLLLLYLFTSQKCTGTPRYPSTSDEPTLIIHLQRGSFLHPQASPYAIHREGDERVRGVELDEGNEVKHQRKWKEVQRGPNGDAREQGGGDEEQKIMKRKKSKGKREGKKERRGEDEGKKERRGERSM